MDFNTENEKEVTFEEVASEEVTTEEVVAEEVAAEEVVVNADTVTVEAATGADKANTLQIVGLVLGIAGIVVCCCLACGGLVLGIAGLVCAIMGNKKGPHTIGKAAMICSIVAIALSVINSIVGIIISALGFTLPSIMDMSYTIFML